MANKQTPDDIIEQLLGKEVVGSETFLVDLPSKGVLYSNFKGATLRPMSFDDEKAAAVAAEEGADVGTLLLSRTLEGVPIEDLIGIDRLYLTLKLRSISMGGDFTTQVRCPNRRCNKTHEFKISTDDLPVKELPEDITDPRQVTLPKTGLTVTVRVYRMADDQFITNTADIYDRLPMFVSKVEKGETVVTDRNTIALLVKKLPSPDIKFLFKQISFDDYGIQPDVKFICPTCKKSTKVRLPIFDDETISG